MSEGKAGSGELRPGRVPICRRLRQCGGGEDVQQGDEGDKGAVSRRKEPMIAGAHISPSVRQWWRGQ